MNCTFRCISNNPMMKERGFSTLEFHETDVLGLFRIIEEEVVRGYSLLTHPLTSSIRPDITPYKTVLLTAKQGEVDMESLELIEKAIRYAEDLYALRDEPIYKRWGYAAKEDFMYIDVSIIEQSLSVEGMRR